MEMPVKREDVNMNADTKRVEDRARTVSAFATRDGAATIAVPNRAPKSARDTESVSDTYANVNPGTEEPPARL